MAIYDIKGNEVQSSMTEANVPIITGDLPYIFITSETAYANVTKETTSKGTFTMVDGQTKMKNVPIKFKLQGSGSLNYAKHNLNITFYNEKGDKQKYLVNDWYPTSKIHLKANEYDYSMVRNSVGARIARDLMGKFLPNGAEGYIRSFPCILYYNGDYMGCHTFNLPQDGKTFNFDDDDELAGTNLAYRCGDTLTEWDNSTYWEYRGDEGETSSMRSVFTNLHSIMSDYTNLTKAIIEEHFDLESLLGYFVLADIMYAVDSLVNNWTLVTWDGETWYHVWYDLDIIFGLSNGSASHMVSPTSNLLAVGQYTSNEFWQKIVELYSSDLADMYATMRENGADAETIYNRLSSFQGKWGWRNIEMDRTVWAEDKQTDADISKSWLESRFTYLDTKYGYVS